MYVRNLQIWAQVAQYRLADLALDSSDLEPSSCNLLYIEDTANSGEGAHNHGKQPMMWEHKLEPTAIFNLLKPTGHVMHQQFNLLKTTGYVMHQQFNIQQLYVLPTLYLCVLYLSENKQRLVPLTA